MSDPAKTLEQPTLTADEALPRAAAGAGGSGNGSGSGGDGGGAAWPPPPSDRYEVLLPSGRKARVLRRITGKHIRDAEAIVGPRFASNMQALNQAIIALCVLVDGQTVRYEDVLEWDSADTWTLYGIGLGKGAPDSPAST